MPGHLPPYTRIITANNEKGLAVIDRQVEQEVPFDRSVVGGTAAFSLAYTTSEFPAVLKDNHDIEKYQKNLVSPPGLTERKGSVLRVVDMAPGVLSPMHRTVSIDYGIVLIGEVELVLDSGEKQLMKAGDVCIQRATNHAWRNASATEWARMIYCLLPSEEVTIDGKVLGEDYGVGMDGVPSSK